jgi:hypothetical protein
MADGPRAPATTEAALPLKGEAGEAVGAAGAPPAVYSAAGVIEAGARK